MNTNSLTDEVFAQLQGAPLRNLSQQLGIGPAQLAGAVSAALPLLIGALGRNAGQPQGASELFGALKRDHRDLDLDQVATRPPVDAPETGRMLGHIFGDRQPRAEQSLGQVTGLEPGKAQMLMRWLAPIVLAYLAKRMFDRRQPGGAPAEPAGDASGDAANGAGPQVLGDILGEEKRRIGQQGGLGGVLSGVLDRDRDGDVDISDLIGLGGSVLGAATRPR
ncbi:MAG: DUF937 domain-containing protein [Gammaproteobacteria bacterium]|nr:DUF937 domain-containing protein [Gammaproteobacteria bacterium]